MPIVKILLLEEQRLMRTIGFLRNNVLSNNTNLKKKKISYEMEIMRLFPL